MSWKQALTMILAGVLSGVAAEHAQAAGRVKVAVIDSGSNIGYFKGMSFVDGAIKDKNGHGTLMAKIIKEVYPQAELYVAKVVGREGDVANDEAVLQALEWSIENEVDVINISLRLPPTERLHETIRRAHKRKILVMAAAGNPPSASVTQNIRKNLQENPPSPVSNDMAYPARYPEVVSVGALDRFGRVMSDSIYTVKVDIFCRGYRWGKHGTSIASAYATGLAAKTIAENPGRTTEEIHGLLEAATGPATK